MEQLSPSIVIDYGSNSIKFGLTGEESPHLLDGYAIGDNPTDSSFPNDFESNFEQILTKLKVDSGKHPVMMTEVPLSAKPQTEQTAQILFEKFNTPATSIQAPGVLALFSSGRLSGLVLDSGHSFTYTLPVSDGKVDGLGVKCAEFGGRELNRILSKMVSFDKLKDVNNNEIVRDIKEKLCYVAFDYSKELVTAVDSKSFNITHKLPDGQEISVGTERFKCTEAMFSPKLFDFDTSGVDMMIFDSISACDEGLRKKLFANILLSGGSSSFQGFSERIRKDISGMQGVPIGLKVLSPQEKINSAWIGGTLVAAQSSFPQACVSKADFEECGIEVIHKKFSILNKN